MKTTLFLALIAAGCATGKSVPRVEKKPDDCILFVANDIKICRSPETETLLRDWGLPTKANPDFSKIVLTEASIVLTDAQEKKAKIIVQTGYGDDTALNTAVAVANARLTLKHGYKFLIAGHVRQTNEQIISLAKGGMSDGMRAVIMGKYVYGAKRSQYVVLVGYWPAILDEVMQHDFEVIGNGIKPLTQE